VEPVDSEALRQGCGAAAVTRVLVTAAVAVFAAVPSWTEPQILSDTAIALGPELALTPSGSALAVWDAEVGPDCAQSPASLTCAHIVSVAARDGTGTWGSPDRIARPGIGARPRVALNEGGRAAVIWVHDIGRDRVVQATYRTAATEPFPNPSDLSAAVLEVRSHQVGLDGAGNVAVVWAERHDQTFDVAAELRSVTSGTWGAPVVLSTGGVRVGPELAVTPAGDAYAVWIEEAGLKVAHANLVEGRWDPSITLSRNAELAADVAVNSAGDAIAAWALADGPGFGAASLRAGSFFGAPLEVRDEGQLAPAAGPVVSLAANGTAVAVWVSGNSLRSAVRAAAGSWSRPVDVAPADLADPAVAVDPLGNAVALWVQRERLVVSQRPVEAGTWQLSEELSGGEALAPRVALDARGEGVAIWNLRNGESFPVLTANVMPSWKLVLENTRRPAIRGHARVGRTVTCDRGDWSGTIPIRFTFAWLRNGRLHGRDRSYHVRNRDSGMRLACRVTASNAAGTRTVTSRLMRVAP
jgi:hypothetical protein